MTLFALPSAMADDMANYKQIIARSFASFEEYDRDKWAYILDKELGTGKNKVTRKESYDPSKPQPWTLLQEFGETPSENRLNEYNDTRAKEATQSDEEKPQDLLSMVKMDTLEVLKTDGHLVNLAFSPILPDMSEQAREMLTGLMVIDTQKQFVKSMMISNIDEVTPVPNVKLSFFAMAFAFVQQRNITLPQNITISIKGKLGGTKPIVQHSSESYSQYRYVGNLKSE